VRQALKHHYSACNSRHWVVFAVAAVVILGIEALLIKLVLLPRPQS
jgi:hypothetical protein